MCASDVRITGYRLADEAWPGYRYFIETEGCKIIAIRQMLFGCGIYPAPIKDVPRDEWLQLYLRIKKAQFD